MAPMLYRLGRASVRRRWLVLGAWIAAVILLVVLGRAFGAGFEDKFDIPGSETQQATDLLEATFPARAGSSAMVVFHTERGTLADADQAATIDATLARIERLPHVEPPVQLGPV